MIGADEYYDLIDKADRYNFDDIKRITCSGYGCGFKYKNIVFILSEHARGKTFKIWIYESEDIKDTLKDEHLEVYGVTGGNRGWTETYGWLHSGSWIDYIKNYFKNLEKRIYEEEQKNEIIKKKSKEALMQKQREQIKKFDNIFSTINK